MNGSARLLSVLLLLTPRAVWPQGTPVGPEFRVNTYTLNAQYLPAVATDASGNFVVVWASSLQDGSSVGVFGQRYDSSGAPLGAEFRINNFTTNSQSQPAVAAEPSGSFLVVWASTAQDGSGLGIFAQRYDSSGSTVGPEFRVNTYITNAQAQPAAAADAFGNFVVVWSSNMQDGYGYGVFGQRYASSGAPLGPEFRVNTYTSNHQRGASVASDPSGNFVVVWGSSTQDGSDVGVFGQRYASSGVPLGAEFRVNTYTTDGQEYPSVAFDSSGNFVVVWYSDTQDGSAFGVFGQRYASSGAPLGPEFRVNTYTTAGQYFPTVAADSAGNFAVVWASNGQDGTTAGIFGQRFASSGTALGPEFRVNSFTASSQLGAAVAADSSGDFVAVWHSIGQDGGGAGVFGQRYSAIVPVELMRFGVE